MRQLFLFFLLLSGGVVHAQEIPIIQKEDLKQWLEADNDTLYVLNFWATWCGPCVAELPAFEKIHERYADQKVKVILINTDFRRNLDTQVKRFVRPKKLQSQVVFINEPNPNDWINWIDPNWTGAIPATLIISKRNEQRFFIEKAMTFNQLEEKIRSFFP